MGETARLFLLSFLVLGRNTVFPYIVTPSVSKFPRQLCAFAQIPEVSEDFETDYSLRFKNVARLYGSSEAMERLRSSHVGVVGLGGVGSWVVEALARSGIGSFTLYDLDDVCISNTNRQIHALTSTVGQFKGEVLKKRILDINPDAKVNVKIEFLRPDNVHELVDSNFSYVVDAADGVSDKCAIVNTCVEGGIPIIVSGGVGGLLDPTLIRCTDMARVTGDSLIMHVRKKLRQKYLYPQGLEVKNGKKLDKKWGVSCVHTLPTGTKRGEPPSSSSNSQGSFRKCDMQFGTACFATGTVGFVMSSVVVNEIANDSRTIPVKQTPRARNLERPQPRSGVSKTPSSSSVASGLLPNSLGAFFASNSEIIGEEAPSRVSEPVLFDAHCHLQLTPLFEASEGAVREAIAKGVEGAAVCGTSPGDDWQKVEQLAVRYPDFVRPQFGLHPWWLHRYLESCGVLAPKTKTKTKTEPALGDSEDAVESDAPCAGSIVVTPRDIPDGWEHELEAVLLRLPGSGVGECGLDKAIKEDISLEVQEHILHRHAQLAQRLGRPLTVHCVGAWGRLQAVLSTYRDSPIILHSANSCSVESALLLAAQPNIYFSFTGRSIQQPRVRQLMRSVPHNRFLIETDSPEQLLASLKTATGRPGEGEGEGEDQDFNKPANLRVACKEIAEALGVDSAQLGELSCRNARLVFDFAA